MYPTEDRIAFGGLPEVLPARESFIAKVKRHAGKRSRSLWWHGIRLLAGKDSAKPVIENVRREAEKDRSAGEFTDLDQRRRGRRVVTLGVTPRASASVAAPPALAQRTFRMGDWVLTPRAATFLKRSPHACIERAGDRIPLRHCSADMEQFALTMLLIAAEYSRRLDDVLDDPRS
ncbi:hypothetical protein [Embleya scabrispora]|uniref:hypothetical protein n=1 Tax=Embleya scabrispora TaxID=159449 RepID=UPI00131A418B|nr:hypothetical protein [Embleya scabrispora]MYS80654.1 hypothetical protein [Streptomyces sp. SID5474]